MKTKGIIFLLISFLGINGYLSAQTTDDATAEATAEIVAGISITKNTDIDFGLLVRTGTGGTAVLDPATGNVSGTADITPIGGAATAAAQFTVAGEDGATFAITLPGTIQLTLDGSTETIDFGTFTLNDAALTGNTLPSGERIFTVGGTLTIGDATAAPNGVYKNTTDFTITVTYE